MIKNKLSDFLEYGYYLIKEAFTPDIAHSCKEIVW